MNLFYLGALHRQWPSQVRFEWVFAARLPFTEFTGSNSGHVDAFVTSYWNL